MSDQDHVNEGSGDANDVHEWGSGTDNLADEDSGDRTGGGEEPGKEDALARALEKARRKAEKEKKRKKEQKDRIRVKNV